MLNYLNFNISNNSTCILKYTIVITYSNTLKINIYTIKNLETYKIYINIDIINNANTGIFYLEKKYKCQKRLYRNLLLKLFEYKYL